MKKDALTLVIKIYQHVNSSQKLLQEQWIEIDGVFLPEHIDYSSIKLLQRGALEAFLTLHYVFCDENIEVCNFRYLVWQLGGLIDRGKLDVSESAKQVYATDDAFYIKELNKLIKAHQLFGTFTEKQQRRLSEKGEWRLDKGWEDLIKASHLPPTYMINMYRNFCGNAHSSYLNVLQIRDVIDGKFYPNLREPIYDFYVMLLSQTISEFIKFFPKYSEEGLIKINEAAYQLTKEINTTLYQVP